MVLGKFNFKLMKAACFCVNAALKTHLWGWMIIWEENLCK